MQNLEELLTRPEFYLVMLTWTLIWKGMALWKAARKEHIVWFVIILVLNTMGLLEIAYIYFLSRWDLGSSKILKNTNKTIKKKA